MSNNWQFESLNKSAHDTYHACIRKRIVKYLLTQKNNGVRLWDGRTVSHSWMLKMYAYKTCTVLITSKYGVRMHTRNIRLLLSLVSIYHFWWKTCYKSSQSFRLILFLHLGNNTLVPRCYMNKNEQHEWARDPHQIMCTKEWRLPIYWLAALKCKWARDG